jgi:ATP-binding cassette, subfamily B, bacterial MsbA
MLKLLRVIKLIYPLLKFYPWGIPAIIFLGILASIAEGIGISLFIPFLQSIEHSNEITFNIPIIKNLNVFLLNGTSFQRVSIIVISILVAILFKVVLSYFYIVLCDWLRYHTLFKLRNQVFIQLMNVGQSFWDVNKNGRLINLLLYETINASKALTFFIWLTINLCVIGILGILLLLISWSLTLLILIAFLLILALTHFLTLHTEITGKKWVQSNIYLNNLTLESFTGIKTIKSFNREENEIKQYQLASQIERDLQIDLQKQAAIIEPLTEGLIVSVLIFVMLIAFWHHLPLSILITFVFMLYRIQPQVQKLNFNLTQILALSNSLLEVYSLLDHSDKPYILTGYNPFNGLKKEICFDSVSFSYNLYSPAALNDISLSIPVNQTTAIVGQSGAGKSTLINLIYRFYNPTSGTIYVDNLPLEDLDLIAWRSRIAIVSQDVHIFSTSIRDNIIYGRPDATEDEMIMASKRAHVHDFVVKLPQGYDTFIGDRGIRLSAGQRQRLSIARAILCDPEILILDEATNSLDSISEQLIQEAIESISKNRTVIIIAHRLSTIEKADIIAVLDHGQIVEIGSFEYLLKLNGLFKQLYQLQQLK